MLAPGVKRSIDFHARKNVSWTASSASPRLPITRNAVPKRFRKCGRAITSKSSILIFISGFGLDRVLVLLQPRQPLSDLLAIFRRQSMESRGHRILQPILPRIREDADNVLDAAIRLACHASQRWPDIPFSTIAVAESAVVGISLRRRDRGARYCFACFLFGALLLRQSLLRLRDRHRCGARFLALSLLAMRDSQGLCNFAGRAAAQLQWLIKLQNPFRNRLTISFCELFEFRHRAGRGFPLMSREIIDEERFCQAPVLRQFHQGRSHRPAHRIRPVTIGAVGGINLLNAQANDRRIFDYWWIGWH